MDDVRLETLAGKLVADVSDRVRPHGAVARARARVLSTPVRHRRVIGRRLALACVAAAALFAAVMLWPRRAAPLTFVAGRSAGVVGEQIGANDGALELAFSDGAAVRLAPQTRARVMGTTARGAELLLEEGSLHASVPSEEGKRDWLFRAGPYAIVVTGTEFETSWVPASGAFSVVMTHGSVIVRGPGIGDVVLRAGERLDRQAASQADPSPTDDVGAPDAAHGASEPSAPSATVASSAGSGQGDVAPARDWRRLAAAGKYREAMAEVSRGDLATVLASGSSADLRLLSTVARYGGKPATARAALVALRARGVRGDTAFVLGKIAADQLGRGGEAARWFRTYLAEAPNGALAEQALGRLLELNRNNGESARRLASAYLERYPSGAYSALARRLKEAP